MFDMGYLTIGLSDIALQYPKIVTGAFDKAEVKNLVEYSYKYRYNSRLYENYRGKFKERTIPASHSFFNFVCDFKIGDKVAIILDNSKFVICEVLEKADLISNLPIKQFVDAKGAEITLEDGLLRRDYKNFIDLGFFVKVKKLTKPIEGILKGCLMVSGSLNKIGDQIEEFVKAYPI